MRTFVISDIHGNNDAFKKALKKIDFTKNDTLILLGDLIDRGNDSKGVLDTVLSLMQDAHNVLCLMGNHERMLLDAGHGSKSLNHWIVNGGNTTLSSFHANSLRDISAKYIELIKSFKYFFETENFIFVHAALNMKIANPASDIFTILWERDPLQFFDAAWLGKRKLIHGHTPHTKTEIISAIRNSEKIICIDNGSFVSWMGYGSLCVLQLENMQVYFFE